MDRIAKIEIYQKDILLTAPFVISLEEITAAQNVFIKIETVEGRVGWGECSPFPTILGETASSSFVMAKYLAQHLINKPIHDVLGNIKLLDRVVAHAPCTKSGFDMALYDLAAQQANLPLYAFLGGQKNRAIHTDMTIGIDEPQAMANIAREIIQDGFDTIKIKLGTNYTDDLIRVDQVRKAVGSDINLRIDANQGWSLPTALRLLKDLEAYQIQWCEAPIAHWNLEGMAQLQAQSPIPIMADESLFSPQDALKHIQQKCCKYFNIKLAKSGGIANAIRIVHLAEAAGILLQVGCFSESRLGITALAHFVHAYPSVLYYDMDSSLMQTEDPVEGGIKFEKGGKVIMEDTPGLGAKLQDKWLSDAESVVCE